jgi:WD40 repeat protein
MLRGELDWIVMKALEKDRTRRYDSASGLARDIQRHLADEAVEACPPTLGYRVRKFARKNKTALTAAAAFAALLLAGIAVSGWQAIRATRAEEQAIAERDDADKARSAEAEQRGVAVAERNTAQDERNNVKAARDELRATLYATRAAQMQTAWETDNVARFVEALEQQRPKAGETDLRNFEWHYWNRLYHSELHACQLPLPEKHSYVILGTWFTVSGSRFAAVGPTGGETPTTALKVWDLATGKELCSVPCGDRRVSSLHFSHDGKRLAATALTTVQAADGGAAPMRDDRAVVWDAVTGAEIVSLSLKGGSIWSQALNADGTRLVHVGNPAFGIRVYDVATGKQVSAFPAPQLPNKRCTFNPDGSRLLVESVSGSAWKILDAGTGQLQVEIAVPEISAHAAFSPNGAHVATVGRPNKPGRPAPDASVLVRVWDAATGTELFSFPSPLPQPDGVTYSPDGKQLAAWSIHKNLVQVWDAATGRPTRTVKGHTAPLLSASFSADSSRLYTVDESGVVKTWDVTAIEEPKPPAGQVMTNVYNSPDGSRQAVCSLSGGPRGPGRTAVSIRDASGNEVLNFKEHAAAVLGVRFSPDGRYVFSQDSGGDWKVWEAATGKVRLAEKWRATVDSSAAWRYLQAPFSADANFVAAPVLDVGVKVWRCADFQEVAVCKGNPADLSLSPDGRRLVTLEAESTVHVRGTGAGEVIKEAHLWDVASGKELAVIPGPLGHVQFNPDGRYFAAGLYSKGMANREGGGIYYPPPAVTVAVWDATTGAPISTTTNGDFDADSMAFSRDGARLAIASRSPRGLFGFIVHEVASGKQLLNVKGHSTDVTRLAFRPDGKRIASLSAGDRRADAEVKLWDAATGSELLHFTAQSLLFGDLVFTANGTRLWVNATRGERQSWDATPLPEEGPPRR